MRIDNSFQYIDNFINFKFDFYFNEIRRTFVIDFKKTNHQKKNNLNFLTICILTISISRFDKIISKNYKLNVEFLIL